MAKGIKKTPNTEAIKKTPATEGIKKTPNTEVAKKPSTSQWNLSEIEANVNYLKDFLDIPYSERTPNDTVKAKAAYQNMIDTRQLSQRFSLEERVSLSVLNVQSGGTSRKAESGLSVLNTRHESITGHAPDLPAIPINKGRQYTPEELTRFADLILEADRRKKALPKKKKKAKTPNTYPESNQFFGTGEGVGDLSNAVDEATDGASNYPGETLEQWLARKGKEAQKNMITPAKAKQAIINRLNQFKALKKGTKVNESGRVMGPEVLHGTRYDPKNFNYGPVRNYLDIETVGTDLYKGSILSYAVIKKAFNLDTGDWDIVSKRTRYYYPTEEDKLLTNPETGEPVYNESIGISGLSDENIERRRKMQLAELGKKKEYAKHWSASEFKHLLTYLGNDPVIGQNAAQFDWPKLILSLDPGKHLTEKDLPSGGLIDTLHLAEGTRGRGPNRNTLSKLYFLCTGHTPEQDGYVAHDALEDVQLTAVVHEYMLKSKSRMGKIARYLLHHPGLSTQFRDEMIRGITEVIGMTPEEEDIMKNIVGDEGTIDEYQADLSFDGSKEISRDVQLQAMGVPLGLDLELKELKEAITRLTASVDSHANQGIANSSVVKQAASLNTVEARKRFLHDALGVTGDLEAEDWNNDQVVAGAALRRANAIYKARHDGRLEDIPEPEHQVRFGEGVDESWFVPIPNIVEDPVIQEWKKQHYLEAERGDSAKSRHEELTRREQERIAEERTKESSLGFNWARANEIIRQDHGDGWVGTYRSGIEQPWEPTKVSDKPGAGLSPTGKENMGYFKLFNEELKKSSEFLRQFGENVKRSTAFYNFEQWRHTANQQADSIYQASAYFVPRPFQEASSRIYTSIKQHVNSVWDRNAATLGAVGRGIKLGSTIVGGITGSVGGPLGALTGSALGTAGGELLAQGTQLVGNYGNRKMKQWGEEVSSRINLWAGITDLYLAPARMVASAFKNLSRISLRFGNSLVHVVESFNKLGLSYTNLTGVTYSQLQRSYVGDRMIGANNGTINNSYNSFANAQMELYGMGQMSQDRVIAAAMTGTFGSVYSYGGDTQEQYAQTVNTIYNQIKNASPQNKQRLMMLAGKIDATLPATLQQMENLGVSDYRSIQKGSWLEGRNVHMYTAADNGRGFSSDEQRARYSRANMEWGGLVTSFTETRNQIAVQIWESFGKNIMSGLNDAFHKISVGDWRGALKDVKKTASEFWSSLTETLFGESKSLNDVGNIFGEKMKSILMKLVPIATTAMGAYMDVVSLGLQKIAPIVMDFIDEIGTRLSYTKVELDWGWDKEKDRPWIKPVVSTLRNTVTGEQLGNHLAGANKDLASFGLPDLMEWYKGKWTTTEGQKELKENKSIRQTLELYDRERHLTDEGWTTPEGIYINSIDKMLNYAASKKSYVDQYGKYDPRSERDVAGVKKLMGEKRVGYMFDDRDYENIRQAIDTLTNEGKAGMAAGIQHLVENLIQIKFDLYEGTSDNPGKKVGSSTYNSGQNGRSSLIGNLHDLVRVTQDSIKEAM